MGDTKKWVRINPEIEYSTDYIFFMENQIVVCKTNSNGTVFKSLIESRIFFKSDAKNLNQEKYRKICREIHNDICSLKYGGEIVA